MRDCSLQGVRGGCETVEMFQENHSSSVPVKNSSSQMSTHRQPGLTLQLKY
jgi:hypothetical protein